MPKQTSNDVIFSAGQVSVYRCNIDVCSHWMYSSTKCITTLSVKYVSFVKYGFFMLNESDILQELLTYNFYLEWCIQLINISFIKPRNPLKVGISQNWNSLEVGGGKKKSDFWKAFLKILYSAFWKTFLNNIYCTLNILSFFGIR